MDFFGSSRDSVEISFAVFSSIVIRAARSATLSWTGTLIHSRSGPLAALCHAMVMPLVVMWKWRNERLLLRAVFVPRSCPSFWLWWRVGRLHPSFPVVPLEETPSPLRVGHQGGAMLDAGAVDLQLDFDLALAEYCHDGGEAGGRCGPPQGVTPDAAHFPAVALAGPDALELLARLPRGSEDGLTQQLLSGAGRRPDRVLERGRLHG